MTVALYCRVSTEEQAEQGFSIDNQRERLIAYCASQGWDDYRLYIDDGYTGTKLDRPEIARMIQHCEQGKLGTVVVYKLDRLSRKQKDVLYLLEDVFDKNNVAFKSATEPFDTATPLGKAMLGILAVFAQLERDTIVERTTSGGRQRMRRGLWRGGRVPFGYRYENGELTVDEVQADLVRRVYTEYLKGRTLSELADWIAQRTRDRSASHALIRDMLDRPIYLGVQQLATGEIAEGSHEAIIDADTWERVQRERTRRKEELTPRKDYLLTGLCRCGECGSSIVRISSKNGKYTYDYYACKNRHVRRRERRGETYCKLPYHPQQKLEDAVEEMLLSAATDPSDVRKSLELESFQSSNTGVIDALRSSLKSVDERLDRWYDAFETGSIDPSKLKERIASLETERKTIRARIEELEDEQSTPDYEPLIDALAVLPKAWPGFSFEERQLVIRTLVRRITLHAGSGPTIEWNV